MSDSSKDWKQRPHKELAVQRFKDAYALYESRQFSGCYYMCGYAIEIGLQGRFKLLGEYPIKDEVTYNKIFDFVFSYSHKNKNRNFPVTVYDFCKNPQKEDKSSLKISLITDGRNSGNTHSIKNLIVSLLMWYEYFSSVSDFQINCQEEKSYLKNFSDKSSLIKNWTTDLRYRDSIKEKDNSSEEDECKNSLKDCLDFLRNFLKISEEFNITINGKSIDIEFSLTGEISKFKESPETKKYLEKSTSDYNYQNKEIFFKSESNIISSDNEEIDIE
jgi:hypothetical protein